MTDDKQADKPVEDAAPGADDSGADDAPVDLLPDPTLRPKPDAKDADADKDKKQESATAYQLRKEKERAAQLETDLKKYKQREEEDRKAKMTEQEQVNEELTALREETARLRRESLITQIGIDAKLPKSMWPRIQGADEEAMRADAEDLAKMVKRTAVGTATDPVRDARSGKREITRSEMRKDLKVAQEAPAKLKSGEWVLVPG